MNLFPFMILLHVMSAGARYHEAIGVPEASRIKERESAPINTRIVNGNQAFLGQHPYFGGLIIVLTTGSVSVCGSTLISRTNLITAAHCWYDGSQQADSFQVVLGSTALFTGGTRINTRQVLTHERYNATNVHHDIAIITIPQVILSEYIQPITLQNDKTSLKSLRAEVVGFGRTSDDGSINIQQQLSSTQVTVIGNELCALLYGEFFGLSMICTEGINGSPCGGDSGGPLLYRNDVSEAVMIGVVSYGSPYGCQIGHPAVYTRISDYIEWIYAQINIK